VSSNLTSSATGKFVSLAHEPPFDFSGVACILLGVTPLFASGIF
jgi:hypothetical protein